MPISQVTMECPCCGQGFEVILVGTAELGMAAPKPKGRRGRKLPQVFAADDQQVEPMDVDAARAQAQRG